MNIFFLSLNPAECAKLYCDQHVIKILLEITQMLYTAWHLTGLPDDWNPPLSKNGQLGYKVAHPNHPMTMWVRSSRRSYIFAVKLGCELALEYRLRYNKNHACSEHIAWLYDNIPKTFQNKQSPTAYYGLHGIPQCMPLEYHQVDPVLAYQSYYKTKTFAKWAKGASPNNIIEMSELEKAEAEFEIAKAKLEKIKSVYFPDNSVYGKFKKIGEELLIIQTKNNIWKNTPLEAINELKADPSGKVGEEFMKELCLLCNITNVSTGDKNSKDGIYDQKIGDSLKKVEIKTARLGGCKYQHESLKKEGCDYWLFIDIKPDGGCIIILPLFDLTQPHPITGTKPHARKGTSDVYKWDFTELHLTKFVTAGSAMRFDKNTSLSQVGDFVRSSII